MTGEEPTQPVAVPRVGRDRAPLRRISPRITLMGAKWTLFPSLCALVVS